VFVIVFSTCSTRPSSSSTEANRRRRDTMRS
jgi:hypothetical protein